MMRNRSLVLVLLLAVARLDAAPPATDEKSPGKSSPIEHKAEHKAEDHSGKRSSAPAKSFKPSEEIGADSAVSFPVDI
ncbi:MAG: hypothetical protein U9P11_07395 [Pseudomonadota bacterium]|nr:hypothetical protein [Pseudomonadota bacterium]